MSTRKLDYLITDVRESTENADVSDSIGIADTEFIRYINDAQFRMQSLITAQHPMVFIKEEIILAVNDQEVYTLPSDIYMGNKVTQIEFSSTGNIDDYYVLNTDVLRNRNSNLKGDPTSYVRKAGNFLVKPVPTTGKFRITYVNKLPKLDLLRGTVLSVVIDDALNTITSLFFDPTTVFNSTEINKYAKLSIVDLEGNTMMKDVSFSSVNASTGEVTISPTFIFLEGESISVGDVVVSGNNSTTHSQLDEMVERYLIAYATSKIFERDSSSDFSVQVQILRQMENDIIASYSEINDDIMEIPIIISEDDSWEGF